jgi:phosphopantothenoylcysteine decarboxylase / phosphopantothenate---cysteine ligase
MDAEMYLNEVTRQNIARLKERGCIIIPPAEGELASGLSGPGRLPEIDIITASIGKILSGMNRDLIEKRILVTAGPTYEAIDPVRFIGNRSSGKMGFAIANAAAQRGAEVTLIAGPTGLETPRNVKRIDVESAQDMLRAVLGHSSNSNAVVMAAAVADFTPVKKEKQKIKKSPGQNGLELKLRSTEDILALLGKRKGKKVLVGFALETANGIREAKEKMKRKNLDLIILNLFGEKNRVFGSDFNEAAVITHGGDIQQLPGMSKFDLANVILDKIRAIL